MLRRLLPLAAVLAAGALHAAPASASTRQLALFEDDSQIKANPIGTLATLKSLGVSTVRVAVNWDSVARARPSAQQATDPASGAYDFGMYDEIDRVAQADGITLDLMLTSPAPTWADASGEPPGGFPGVWNPSPSAFRAFAEAVGRRYDGTFAPPGEPRLPRVRIWSLWNEPNYGFDIAPQVVGGVETAAAEYRALLDAGWAGLAAGGHTTRHDTILIGELAPRGVDRPGTFNGVKPLRFLRALYCVDSRFRPLRGRAASERRCPTTAAASRRFRAQHPGLFRASGFAAHLYASQANPGPPTQPTSNGPGARGNDPDFADLPAVGRLEATLDRLNRVYGSRSRYRIWDTEYGYRTRPPDPHAGVSQATAAYWLNWGEYISYKNPRIVTSMQYLLVDPPGGMFASGLVLPNGRTPKQTFDAYRMPLYLPATSTRRGHSLDVWGCVRPAHGAFVATGITQRAFIEFRRNSRAKWTHVATVRVTNPSGYFETRVRFPGSGQVRIAWAPPGGGGDYSRITQVAMR